MHRHARLVIVLLAVIVVLIGAGFALRGMEHTDDPLAQDVPAREQGNAGAVRYENAAHHLAFEHGASLYAKETARQGEQPMLEVLLVEDTPDNRALVDGTAAQPGETPENVTVAVYANPDRLAPREWVAAETTWTAAASAADFRAGAYEGITYSWDGLYQGRSAIFTQGDRAYVLSVSYIGPESPILDDFDEVLASMRL